jgi:hypothetical protein
MVEVVEMVEVVYGFLLEPSEINFCLFSLIFYWNADRFPSVSERSDVSPADKDKRCGP